jgi:hypothetical protein
MVDAGQLDEPGVRDLLREERLAWSMLMTRSPVRCRTSVGTLIDGSTLRTSISRFICHTARAAPGLAEARK